MKHFYGSKWMNFFKNNFNIAKIFNFLILKILLPVIKIFSIMPSALVILAEGAEEIELVGTVDVLRRAGVRTILQFPVLFNSIVVYFFLDYCYCGRTFW